MIGYWITNTILLRLGLTDTRRKKMKQNDFYEVDGCMDFIPVKLIEEYKDVKSLKVEAAETGFKIFVPSIYRFPKANEPQKPVVPQFVAEWLEKSDWRKDTLGRQTIFDVFDNLTLDASNGFYVDVKKWVEENGNIFAQAWVFGYTVEKEKLYTVEIPNPNTIRNEHVVLVKNVFKQIVMAMVYGDNWRTAKGYHLTESEIKRDFDWAWQFAKEVE